MLIHTTFGSAEQMHSFIYVEENKTKLNETARTVIDFKTKQKEAPSKQLLRLLDPGLKIQSGDLRIKLFL